jgi:hypothetical protein
LARSTCATIYRVLSDRLADSVRAGDRDANDDVDPRGRGCVHRALHHTLQLAARSSVRHHLVAVTVASEPKWAGVDPYKEPIDCLATTQPAGQRFVSYWAGAMVMGGEVVTGGAMVWAARWSHPA